MLLNYAINNDYKGSCWTPYLDFSSSKKGDEEGKRIRRWAFNFLRAAIRSIKEEISLLQKKHEGEAEWPKDDIKRLKGLLQVAHTIALEVFFGSGAHDSEDFDKQNDGEKVKERSSKGEFLYDSQPLLTELCSIEFVETAYDVLKTLEYLIEVDPLKILLLIEQTVTASKATNIHYESLAADLIVRIVERYLGENKHLLRADSGGQLALLNILDIFIEAGWPKATRLTYRLDEVFR